MSKVIYEIKNKENGKRYIGSTKNWERRQYDHRVHLNNGLHHNQHLQNAWDKYKEESFEFRVIERHDGDVDIKEIEQSYFDVFSGTRFWASLYNIREDVDNIGGSSLLNGEDVIEIRVRYRSEDISCRKLSEEYGVSEDCVRHIIVGRTWVDAGGPIKGQDYDESLNVSLQNRRDSKFCKSDIEEIRFRYRDTEDTLKDISVDYDDASVRYISSIVHGEVWLNVGGPIAGEDYKNIVRKGNFSDDEVIEIRKRYKTEDVSTRDLLEDYDSITSNSVIVGIINGDRRPEAGGPIKGKDYGEVNNPKSLSKEEVVEIRGRYYLENISQSKLAEIYNVNQTNISSIVLGKTWKYTAGPIKGKHYE